MTNILSDEPTLAVRARPVTPRADNISEAYLARKMLRPAKEPKPTVYEFTSDPGYLHQYYRLREEMFISVWGLQHFSGQQDSFDEISDIMVARQGLQCVAGGRLTVSSPQEHRILPMEKEDVILKDLFPELDLNECTYGEFSRLAILPEFRGGAVFPEIAKRFIKKAIGMNVQYAFNIAPQPLARSYRQVVQLFGLNWDIRHEVQIPEREEYEGIQMVLSIMDLTRFSRKKHKNEAVLAQNEQEKALAD